MAESDTQKQTEEKRNVMIAMDGSKHAIYAFEWYAENVYQPTDNVIMAHCAEHGVNLPPTALMAGNPTVIQAMMKEHEEEVMKVFRTIDELANKHNIKHTLERLNGPPGESLIKAAEQQDVTLIIAGSRGHGTIRRTIMGSTGDYIVHHSHVPVLIVKHEDEHHKLK
ncbi:universal stress protein Slr1101-like [Ruditapes philippinarum]|uniref:universal stress protein Slr1101-like n=1 Tax=Ruditapes philippinarum TaxID=129788 RepID=UPI00295A9335|nr:universal stress protein Slr1101-like [Ruditapes philippinarum]